MKFRLTFVLTILLLAGTSFAQYRATVIKLGYYSPGVCDGGFIVGAQWLHAIDENLDMGVSLDWFNKNFTDQHLVDQLNDFNGGVFGTTNELRAKTNLNSFPLLYTLNVQFPMQRGLDAYVTGGLGFDLLIINYRDYEDPSNDNIKGAIGFSWRIGAGVIYRLGTRSDFIGELSYHNSEPSWQYTVNNHVFERSYDMSGLMIRAGIKFYY
jgi:opacity protein-like surface antigen